MTATLTGWRVLVYVLSFFALIIGVNAVMMVMAIKTMPGVVVKSPFDASQHYNERIDEARGQDKHGWTCDVQQDGRRLIAVFKDATGSPLNALVVRATLQHPTDSHHDRTSLWASTGDGRYESMQDITSGVWTLQIEAYEKDERVYVSRNRIVLK